MRASQGLESTTVMSDNRTPASSSCGVGVPTTTVVGADAQSEWKCDCRRQSSVHFRYYRRRIRGAFRDCTI